MKHLQISKDLALPLDAVTQTVVVYGGKGMGKTNFGSVFAEELHAAALRFSVIDPMGVWWGLQHGRRRGDPGLEVLLLGGVHGDLPIEPTGGEVVADLVADESISVVIDVSRRPDGKAWSKGEKVRFVTAYMLRLYERQVERRRPLMQIIDEAARYAPQGLRSGDVDEAKCLGAIAMVCEEGRNLGIGLTLLTQRSARLNKDVAELADVLVAFRTVGPNSVGAITDWLGDHVARERHKSIVERLRQLPVGTALFVSPGWLGFEGVVSVRERRTFDSSKTPRAGERLPEPGGATKPDLEKYRARMAATIERAKADDPRELRKRIAELEKQLREAQSATPQVETKTVREQVPVFDERARGLINDAAANLRETSEQVLQAAREISAAVERAATLAKVNGHKPARPESLQDVRGRARVVVVPPRQPQPPVLRPAAEVSDGEEITRPQQRLLDALAWFESVGLPQPSRTNVAAIAGVSPRSSGFEKNISTLRARHGFIDYPRDGALSLTEKGRAAASAPSRPGTLEELHGAWLRSPALSGPQREMLEALIRTYPHGFSREALAEALGRSVLSSGFEKNVSTLSGLSLVTYPSPGHVAASALLFPEGLS